LLRRRSVDLSTVLRAQRTLLEQKKNLLERAITAIGQAETTLQTCGEADSGVFRHVIEVIEMQNKRDVWKQKYDELMQGKIERLRPISPDARTRLREQFADLFKEVEGALGEDPASPRAQEMAGRFVELLQPLTPKGEFDPQFLKFAAAYLSDGGWPAGAPAAELPFGGIRVWEFMAKALAARPWVVSHVD
jgi:hypothetical protein